MYISDLSKYPSRWGESETQMDLIAVGWLDSEHSYQQGTTSLEFRNRIELFCSNSIIRNFGVEPCALCKREPVIAVLHSGIEVILYGTYEIRIPSHVQRIYAAPDLILHYIIAHNYKPPQEFIDAVLSAPLPGTQEFEKFAESWSGFR